MMFEGRNVRWIAAWLASMGGTLLAGQFAPPGEGPVAFRRDQIPLDAEAMIGLSKQLEALARGTNPKSAADRRGVAQMLAVALALDPVNKNARELITEYEKNHHSSVASDEHVASCRLQIAQFIAWLETPDAGSQGQALAACLKDIISRSDPQHPATQGPGEGVELGAWTGWIPNLSAYETPQAVKPIPRVTLDPIAKPEILLSKAEVQTMLWKREAKDAVARWVLAVAPLQMSISKVSLEDEEKVPPLSIGLGSAEDAVGMEPLCKSLHSLLKKTHPSLPPGYRITITSKEFEDSLRAKKRQSISAAAAVLASAAITGREPDALILGQVDEAGNFKLASGFWEQIHALGKGTGQRLVLPTEAADCLPSLLAMENPGFFLDYEVLLAKDFQQLLDLTAKSPDEPLAKTSAQFRAIHDRLGTQDIRQYIATGTPVRQRLLEIFREVPYHLSAKMLLIQAAGLRPTTLTHPVFAAELRRAIEPMDWIVKTAGFVADPGTAKPENGFIPNRSGNAEFSSADLAKLNATFDLCRSRVDGLARYAEKDDRELQESTRKSLDTIRNLERAAKKRGESSTVNESIRSACRELIKQHKEMIDRLSREAGALLIPPGP